METKITVNVDDNGKFKINGIEYKIDVIRNQMKPDKPMLQLYKEGQPWAAVYFDDLKAIEVTILNSQDLKNMVTDAIKNNWGFGLNIDDVRMPELWLQLMDAKWHLFKGKHLFSAPYANIIFANIAKIATNANIFFNHMAVFNISNDIAEVLHHMENDMDDDEAYDTIVSDDFISHYTNDAILGTVIKTALAYTC